MKVCICTAFDTGFASLAEITLPVLVRYCARHGYALRTEMNPPGDIYWRRTYALLDALKTFDVAVWMDTDAVVTNHTKRVEEFLPHGIDMIVSKDHHGINDGVIITRHKAERVLHRILHYRNSVDIHAPQDALQRAYDVDQSVRDAVDVVRNKLFNAFHSEGEGDHWEPGDFLLQMPGCNRERRIELAKSAVQQIVS